MSNRRPQFLHPGPRSRGNPKSGEIPAQIIKLRLSPGAPLSTSPRASITEIMMSSNDGIPQLGFWEKADIPFVHLSIYASMVYAAITGVFRGKASPKRYDHHILAAVIRKVVDRRSDRQMQYVVLCLIILHINPKKATMRIYNPLTLYYRTGTSCRQLQRPTKPS